MTLPTFLVLGAARCGTTSLHYWLAQHPDVSMSGIKEPNHFLFRPGPRGPVPLVDDPRIVAKSVPDPARYARLFDPAAPARGDVSPLYLYTRDTPDLVRDADPAMRLVAVLRDPVERAWSHFAYVNPGLGPEAAVAVFAEAVDRELGAGYTPYRTGTHFLRLSAYAEQLRRWLAAFPREQLLVLDYRDLVARPAATLATVSGFVGVDGAFAFDPAVAYNPSTTSRGVLDRVDRLARPAYPRLKRALPAGLAGRLARRRARARAARRVPGAPPLPPALRDRLDAAFAADIAWVRAEFGLALA